tara:strand:+ start:148 stop:363 length:216 start_codon:yes stop_codon:yes gene_type:complete
MPIPDVQYNTLRKEHAELEEENSRLRKRIAGLVLDQCRIRQANNVLRRESRELKRKIRSLEDSHDLQFRLP